MFPHEGLAVGVAEKICEAEAYDLAQPSRVTATSGLFRYGLQKRTLYARVGVIVSPDMRMSTRPSSSAGISSSNPICTISNPHPSSFASAAAKSASSPRASPSDSMQIGG